MTGETLAHYRILDELGAGGMGEVYLAEDTTLGRRVALKLLPAELAESPERLERFEREARTLAALDHPNIVTIHSVEEAEGVRFLTMAYVEGKTLGELIPPGGLPLERLLELAVAFAEGLRAAHERGIVHRDLKPGNVMVDTDGRLRILDFGLAKLQPDPGSLISSQAATETMSPALTREGSILGTYPYMSPEQAEGKAADGRSDLFSFGVVLYEMATGERPFVGETPASLISSILKDAPRPLGQSRPELPPELGEIVERCLEKDPKERVQTAAELRDALAELAGQVAAGEARPASRRLGTRPWHLRALAAIVVLLAVLAGLWLWRAERAPPVAEEPQIASLAVLPLRNLSGDPEQEYFADGMTEALITDLSKIGALKVISRSSAMRYKGTEKPVEEIAAELGVDSLVEGSVVREGDRVGITAQLIEAATGETLWAERYERDLVSILSLQGEIARAVARQVEVTLTPEEERRLTEIREVDPEAFEAYQRGVFHLQRLTEGDLDTALGYFERALEIDPTYAPGWVGLGKAWRWREGDSAEARAHWEPALERALELDPELAEAHYMVATERVYGDWDWKEAEKAFRRAIALDPGFAEGRVFYGHLLSILGRWKEAAEQTETGLELDPLNPFIQGMHATQLLMARRQDEAIERFREILRTNPGAGFGKRTLADALRDAGRHEEALQAFKTVYTDRGRGDVVAALDRGFEEGGYAAAYRRAADVLAASERAGYEPPVALAAHYLNAGDTEEALRWLERAVAERGRNVPYIGVMPTLEPLHDLPRFRELARRVGVPILSGPGDR